MDEVARPARWSMVGVSLYGYPGRLTIGDGERRPYAIPLKDAELERKISNDDNKARDPDESVRY